jgi:hypothetical protein
MLDQGPAEKDTGETKEKGRNANQVVMLIHANPGSHVESRFSIKETREKKGVMKPSRVKATRKQRA